MTLLGPSSRLIPEATVDAWSVASLTADDKDLRFACPTPAQQALEQPWDIVVEWPSKRFMIENKALRVDGRIDIPRDQLDNLVELAASGVPIFYGLPAPDIAAIRGRSLVECRFTPDFETWHRILRPSEVRRLVGTRQTLTSETVAEEPTKTAPSLRQFLNQLKACEWVPITPPNRQPDWSQGFERLRSLQIERRQSRQRQARLYSVAAVLRMS
jgi:hypothetical protein